MKLDTLEHLFIVCTALVSTTMPHSKVSKMHKSVLVMHNLCNNTC